MVVTCGSTATAVNLEMTPPVLMTIGPPKKGETVSSIKEWVLMKFRFMSGKDFVSLLQVPGRGLGTYQGKLSSSLTC